MGTVTTLLLRRNTFLRKSHFIFQVIMKGNGKTSVLGFSSVQFSSVAQSYPTLCDPMNFPHLGSNTHCF